MTIKIEIPLKTVSEANASEHWSIKAKRHRVQQIVVRSAFMKVLEPIPIPCVVKLTRIAPRSLDKEDNLPMSVKWIKDEIVDIIFPDKRKFYVDKKGKVRQLKGRSDDNPKVTWEYNQEKNKTYGIRIEICSL